MELEWLVVTLIVLVVVVALFKSQDLVYGLALIKKYSLMLIGLGILAFFVISLMHINKTYTFNLTSISGVLDAFKVYFLWFKGLLSNFGDITGYAVKQDWFTNSTK